MFIEFVVNNKSLAISFVYFLFYAYILLAFLLLVGKYPEHTENLHALTLTLRYAYRRYIYFTIVILSFLGLPPTLLFNPKFVAMAEAWVNGDGFFFIFIISVVFFSFALYVQIIDLFFTTSDRKKYILAAIESITSMDIFFKDKERTQVKWQLLILFIGLIIFGVLLFKDIYFFILSLL